MPGWIVSDSMWNAMFVAGVPLMEKILRTTVVYVALVALLRVFGKRELAQLNPFDLVVLLSLSNTVQNALIGADNSVTGGVVGAVGIMGINYLVVRFLFRHRRLDQLFEGKPAVLINNGRVDHKALTKELLTHAELMTVLHRQGFSHLDEVARCVLEPGGTFSISPKDPPREEVQHADLIRRLEAIDEKLGRLVAPGGA
jgi:uncharacterized membrane protein YcaP (DUF421 family)